MSAATTNSAARVRRWHRLGVFSLALYAASAPWELFQRVPLIDGTLVKIAAFGCIVSAGVLVLVLRTTKPSITDMHAPIAAFAAVSLLSLAFTIDRSLTLQRIVLYAMYALFFVSATVFTRDVRVARRVLLVYIASSTALAVYTGACYWGWCWPTYWDTSLWAHQPLLLEYRAGVPLRMAAASVDFNAPAMVLLCAFAASLFLFDIAGMSWFRRWLLFVSQAVIVWAIAIAMSRSALSFAALVLLVRALQSVLSRAGRSAGATAAVDADTGPAAPRRQAAKRAAVLSVIVIAALLAGVVVAARLPFVQMLLHRAEGGLGYDDPSVSGRQQVYRIALELLPKYMITGSGLGTVDVALAQSPYAENAVMTVHSMPLALALELGLLGVAAWAWLWWRLARASVRCIATADSALRRNCAAFLAMAAAILGMTLIQPFATAPIYPLVLALGIGPIPTRRKDTVAPTMYADGRGATWAAVVLSAAVVFANASIHQVRSRAYERYFDLMRTAQRHEHYGEWSAAAHCYDAAATALGKANAASAAATVTDIAPVLATCGILHSDPDPVAAALFAGARAELYAGHWPADRFARAMRIDPQLHLAAPQLADALWTTGYYQDAVALYAALIREPLTPPTLSDLRRLRKLETRIPTLHPTSLAASDRHGTDYFGALLRAAETGELEWPAQRRLKRLQTRLDELGKPSDDAQLLEQADLLRRLGRWDEAVQTAERIVRQSPQNAHALFLLGVQEALSGRSALAREYFMRALAALPNHHDARTALERLQSGNTTTP